MIYQKVMKMINYIKFSVNSHQKIKNFFKKNIKRKKQSEDLKGKKSFASSEEPLYEFYSSP